MATTVALAMCAVGFLPLILHRWVPQAAIAAGLVVATFVLAIGFANTGIFERGSLARTDVAELVPAEASLGRCQEIFSVLRDAGVVLGEPGESTLTVRGAFWDQIPAPIRDAATACAASPDSTAEVEIIRR
ncbi:MAG TPA: hypothetical protein VEB68_12555 [Croceibacterium sp.]|nr:hypothetical protein [Croceibacterium sp.]